MASNPNGANDPQIGFLTENKSTTDEITGKFLLEEYGAGFSANDLVWGKIKSHPWWPGQIFDTMYASEMALRCQKKDHFLVAYFGDKSFAWVPESQLKHFQSSFSEMEKQSSADAFVNAVSAVLEEVSKRVELGLACHCSADGSYNRLLEYRKVENTGIREGTCSVVDKFRVANAFQPESLLKYVWALARCPSGGFVRLELTIAAAQLKTFYRSKGHPQLPVFASHIGLVENEAEILHLKSKRPRGRPRKNQINENGSERKGPSSKMEEEEDVDYLADGDKSGRKVKSVARSSARKRMDADIDSAEMGRSKDGLGEEVDLKTETRSSARSRTRSVRLDDNISQAASRLKVESPLILNSCDETPQNSVTKWNRRKAAGHSSKAEKENEVAIEEYSSPSEMLSQLHLVARDPMTGYDFLPMIKGFFTDFRVSFLSNSSEDQEPMKSTRRQRGRKKKVASREPTSLEMSDPDFRISPSSISSEDQEPVKSTGRRGRKKKVVDCKPDSLEMSDPDFRFSLSSNSSDDQEPVKSMGTKRGRKKKVVNFGPDYVQDSYWSDIILQSSPEREPASRGQKRKGGSQKKGRMKKTKPVGDSVLYDPEGPSTDTEQNNLLVHFSTSHEKQEVKGESIVEETPTALILSFNESNSLPSAADLIKIFSSYGSLREEETEVLRKTNRAKVVFRYRHDAENAFSSAGRSSVFGPALVSYRLRYTPSPKSSPASSPQDMNDAVATKDCNLEHQGQEGVGLTTDKM